ncbi:MAG: isochorismatase family protein [Nitrososphaerales archaeon]
MRSDPFDTWRELLSPTERKVINSYSPGFSDAPKFGKNPLFLIIDCTYKFAGLDAPIEESIKKWPLSCGESAWKSINKIIHLLRVARKQEVKVAYTFPVRLGSTTEKGVGFRSKLSIEALAQEDRIVDEIAPNANEFVIEKSSPSAFFSTPLVAWLLSNRIDSLFVVGGSTSGCVRSTVVDGSAYRFPMFVIKDCVFDRVDISHRVALLDIQMKYGNLVSHEQVSDYFKSL